MNTLDLQTAAETTEGTVEALQRVKRLWPDNLLEIVRDGAPWPEDEPIPTEAEAMEGHIEQALIQLRRIEADLGQYSPTYHEFLENLRFEIDYRLRTGSWGE